MRGERTILDLDDLTIHVHSGVSGVGRVNSVVFELADELVVLDSQVFVPDAEEFADLIAGLDKPVTRFLLSHNHPDHWSGFAVLDERFPGVPLAALAPVREYVSRLGPDELATRRAAMGPVFADRVVAPTVDLAEGEETIGGVRFRFTAYDQAEAEHQLVIELPDHGVLVVVDLAARPEDHVYALLPDAFDHWIEVLEELSARPGVEHVIIGHGRPTDREALAASIAYLTVAKEVYETSAGREEYAATIRARFPDRIDSEAVDRTGMWLYGSGDFEAPSGSSLPA